jgi:hypothetical protein
MTHSSFVTLEETWGLESSLPREFVSSRASETMIEFLMQPTIIGTMTFWFGIAVAN